MNGLRIRAALAAQSGRLLAVAPAPFDGWRAASHPSSPLETNSLAEMIPIVAKKLQMLSAETKNKAR
ncbi:MAG: hypothetical protein IIB76_12015 [Proteobacteria bacterium]|nr:hypothetical protein [Pseudomonadota bacterium]